MAEYTGDSHMSEGQFYTTKDVNEPMGDAELAGSAFLPDQVLEFVYF